MNLYDVNWMKNELEKYIYLNQILERDNGNYLDTLAYVREELLDYVDVDNPCGDMLACAVSQPTCMSCLAKNIKGVIVNQQKEIEQLKEVYKDREDDIEFYWSMFHQIENVRLNPNTSDDEKWEKIGELISSILVPNEF